MEELVGEYGYESTTVPQVIKAARVSTATFYRFFSDKVDCFIALCEERGERLLSELLPDEHELRSYTASAAAGPWPAYIPALGGRTTRRWRAPTSSSCPLPGRGR